MKRRKRGRPPRKELTDTQRLAIEIMVWHWKTVRTHEDVAKRCGVSRMALYKWRTRNKRFQREYDRELTRYLNVTRPRLRYSRNDLLSDFKLLEKAITTWLN
ncbi:phBC6A51 family helix-turn-helix protein [Brevibacillus sp. NPDC003359]|uniref:phBC6A51 family helix-turn-helix protein n=1 Tax=unclassified Brevibacillus TaxID=2684853 RepID=UPI003679F52E